MAGTAATHVPEAASGRCHSLIAHKALNAQGVHIDRFRVVMEDGTEVLHSSRSIMSAAAREMLKRGLAEPGDLVTLRHAENDRVRFKPKTVAEAAKWTVEEGDRRGLQRRRFRKDPRFEGGAAQDVLEAAAG